MSDVLSFHSSEFMPFEDRLRAAERKFGPAAITDQVKASFLIQDLAWQAWTWPSFGGCRGADRGCKCKRCKPGAFIKMLPKEKRELLKNLKSASMADVRPPPIYRVGSKENPLAGVLTWSAPTVWKLS